MSKDYIQPIINPENPTGPKTEAILPHRLILRYYKFHPVRYENLRAAKHVLETLYEFSVEYDNSMKAAGALRGSLYLGTSARMLKLLFLATLFSQCTLTASLRFMNAEPKKWQLMIAIARKIGKTDTQG